MKTGFSLLEILHRENPVFITGMGLQCILNLKFEYVVYCHSKFKFQVQDSDLEYFFGDLTNTLLFFLHSLRRLDVENLKNESFPNKTINNSFRSVEATDFKNVIENKIH